MRRMNGIGGVKAGARCLRHWMRRKVVWCGWVWMQRWWRIARIW